jgi:ribosomal protein L12E/L44/L45/RPP1/RPP2
MTKHLIASFVAIGLLAGPAAAATNTKAPTEKTEKAKSHKAHAKKTNMKEDSSKTPSKTK